MISIYPVVLAAIGVAVRQPIDTLVTVAFGITGDQFGSDLCRRPCIRRLLPILGLLKPADRDQMTGFAEHPLAFIQDIRDGYRDQAREFKGLKKEIQTSNENTKEVLEQLRFLIDGV
ncbi:hypothetical protein [Tateyamaria sp. ANG-S1]|uniref:hypothetical protein n=1 Tax=Tateyamaria sp. ANG-S1 TaxID=1577905 RepID=UPI00057E606C|nr:hypothetical protein [Tateyamaria sp. ANG-S1]KIC47779.1 hypothetical protein RA29_19060 [Tateyamaria sp. ANG-S1]